MTAAFTLNFDTPILERQVTVGRYDGKNPSLTAATTGGKVLVHSAHHEKDPIKFLNVNRQTTALTAGRVDAANSKSTTKPDVLFVGSQAALVAYDIEENRDLFFKEVTDGIHTLCFGRLGKHAFDMALVGGNCSIQGFDHEGEEKFWTVTGDNVSAITLLPWAQDAAEPDKVEQALLVASEDLELRVFEKEDVLCQVAETAPVVQLVSTAPRALGRFVYGLGNGTVGVYDRQTRAWRFKTKHQMSSIATCDVDLDGVPEVLVGWTNGKFEVRSDHGVSGGDSMFKDHFDSPVSAIAVSDYRKDGRDQPLVCAYDGTCRGYVAVETSMDEAVLAAEQQQLEKLTQQKQDLQFEMQSLEKQIAQRKNEAETAPTMPTSQDIAVKAKLKPNPDRKSIELILSVNEGAVIQGATVRAEVIFGALDSIFVTADDPSDHLTVALQPEKNASAELLVSAMVGFQGAEAFQVHDLTVKLPRFAMFVPIKELGTQTVLPKGSVTMRVNERMNRLVMWGNASFLNFSSTESKTEFHCALMSLRDGEVVMINAKSADGGELSIRADSIDVCGDIIEDLGSYLGLTELQSTADFPREFDAFQQVLTQVDEFNTVRLKLTAEMAESSQLVKALVIKAEDARILSDMKYMKRMYSSLYDVNKELMGEFMKRSNNHTELMAVLKEVNAMVQRGSRLRIGQPKAQLVSSARDAIRSNKTSTLFNIVRTGKP